MFMRSPGENQEHVRKNNVHPSFSPLPPPPAPHLLYPDGNLSNTEMSPISPFPAAHTGIILSYGNVNIKSSL